MEFENACGKIKATVIMAGEKTEKFFDRQKIKIDLSITENELCKLYADLGKAVYESGKSAAIGDSFSELTEKISEKIAEADRLKEKIGNLK